MTGSKPAALPLGYIPAMYLLIVTFVTFEMVRVKRLELSHLSIPAPKAGASTRFRHSRTLPLRFSFRRPETTSSIRGAKRTLVADELVLGGALGTL